MSETQVEIADGPNQASGGAYRNLWVPLIVVPAAIVIVLVLVFALFGALAGEQAGPAQNLERIVSGGSNERRQALYTLVAQLGENHRARREGRTEPHPVEAGFLEEVKRAVGSLEEENPEVRLTLGILLATQGEREGEEILTALLAIPEDADPDGRTRFYAIMNLGLMSQASSLPAIRPFLTHADVGLRTVAAGALRGIGGPAAREALLPVLDDAVLEVRLTAALALSHFDPPELRAADVLRSALQVETYAAERQRDAARFRQAELVSQIRVEALRGLARLGPSPEDRTRIEGLREDPDLAVVAAAREILAGKGGGTQ